MAGFQGFTFREHSAGGVRSVRREPDLCHDVRRQCVARAGGRKIPKRKSQNPNKFQTPIRTIGGGEQRNEPLTPSFVKSTTEDRRPSPHPPPLKLWRTGR